MQPEYAYGERATSSAPSTAGLKLRGAELPPDTLMIRRERGVLFADVAVPPMNGLSSQLVRDLVSLLVAAEADETAKVIVFGSAIPNHFVTDADVPRIAACSDATARLGARTSPGALFHRLNVNRLVSIARIEGRTHGVGNAFALACDVRFAAKENAIFSQPDAALGLIPGADRVQHLAQIAKRAKALEIVLGAGDYDAAQAERYGWVNRALPEAALSAFVSRLAHGIANLPADRIAAVKSRVNALGLADADETTRIADHFPAPHAQARA